jgi:uncharacterized membrane protein
MENVKSWLESKTIWMALVVMAPVVSNYIGFDFGATLNDLVTIAGSIGVIYFRITAKKALKVK